MPFANISEKRSLIALAEYHPSPKAFFLSNTRPAIDAAQQDHLG